MLLAGTPFRSTQATSVPSSSRSVAPTGPAAQSALSSIARCLRGAPPGALSTRRDTQRALAGSWSRGRSRSDWLRGHAGVCFVDTSSFGINVVSARSSRARDRSLLYCVVKCSAASLYRQVRQSSRAKLVLDLFDPIWLPLHGWGDSHAISAELSEWDAIICENDYLAGCASPYNRRVFVVPDSPQIEVFDELRGTVRRDPQRITLGWIGGQTNVGPLFKLVEPLEALFERFPQLHLRIVGADPWRLPPFEKVRYSCRPTFNQEQMAREVLAFDIGLFPLFHNEQGRARGTLKAKVYMSGGAVAVCENYGENPKLIEDDVNGCLASSQDEWYAKLARLIIDADRRTAIAERGLATIRERYTATHMFGRLIGAFDKVLSV